MFECVWLSQESIFSVSDDMLVCSAGLLNTPKKQKNKINILYGALFFQSRAEEQAMKVVEIWPKLTQWPTTDGTWKSPQSRALYNVSVNEHFMG